MSLENVYDYTPRYYDTSRAWHSWRTLNPFIEDLATRRAPDINAPHPKPIDALHRESYGGIEGRDYEANPDWGLDIKRKETGIQDHWRESIDRSGSGRTDILDWGGAGPQSQQRQFNKALLEGDIDWDYYNQNPQYTDLAALASERASSPGLFGQDWAEFDDSYRGTGVQQIRYINELLESGSEPEAGQYGWDEILQHYTEPEGPTWDERLEEIQGRIDEAAGDWGENLSNVEQDFANQFSNINAAIGAVGSGLAGHAEQFSDQLRLAQEGWANQLAAAEAGWDTERAAWNQQEADWTQQYAQQQRQIETQLATEREEYENQLESMRNVYGVQTEEQRTAWEEQSAQERADFATQLEQYQLESTEEAEEWRQRYAQSQEQQRIADAIQRRDLEASLADFGNQYQRDWAEGSRALQSDYQRLIDQARSDSEIARLEQARDFERLQRDQFAAYNQRDQELAAKDRVFDTQLDDLRRQLGIERDLYGQAQDDFLRQQSSYQQQQEALRDIEQQRLQQSLGGFQQQLDADVSGIQGQLDRFTGRQLPEGWTRQEPTTETQMGAGGIVQLPDGSLQTGHDFVNQPTTEPKSDISQYPETWSEAVEGGIYNDPYFNEERYTGPDIEASRQGAYESWIASKNEEPIQMIDPILPGDPRFDGGKAIDKGTPSEWSLGGDVGAAVITNWRNPTTGEVYQAPSSNVRPPEGSGWEQVAHGDPDFDRQWEEQRGRYDSPLDQKIGTVKKDLTGQIGDIKTSLTGDLTKAQQESALARGKLQTDFTGQLGDVRTGLTGQIGDVKSGLESQLGQVRQDVTGQIGDFRADIADYKDTLAGQNEAQEAYYAANKRFREMQIQDAERARTAQAYGSPGTTMNQRVKGVRRAGSSKPGGLVRSRSPRNVFNRSGLRISSLNI